MGNAEAGSANMAWLTFALMTVACWGLYGIFLHSGQVAMKDLANGRWKAFLFVGIAYFITAVIGPIVMLKAGGAEWTFPNKGILWSILAGLVGAVGAFGVLLAFGAGGKPAAVMSIIFAGAPIVNAIVAIAIHPPEGGIKTIKPAFFVGIVLAALGGYLVTAFKPGPTKPPKPAAEPPVPSPDSPTGGEENA